MKTDWGLSADAHHNEMLADGKSARTVSTTKTLGSNRLVIAPGGRQGSRQGGQRSRFRRRG